MTKYRVSEYSSHAGIGLIEPKFYENVDEVAKAILSHKKDNDAIHERNKKFSPSEKMGTTGLDIHVMGLTGPRPLTPEEGQKLRVAYDRAVENDKPAPAVAPRTAPRSFTPG